MSTSSALEGWQFELNRPLSDSAQKLSASASSHRRHSAAVALATMAKEASGFGASVTVRDTQDPFRVTIQATPFRSGS